MDLKLEKKIEKKSSFRLYQRLSHQSEYAERGLGAVSFLLRAESG